MQKRLRRGQKISAVVLWLGCCLAIAAAQTTTGSILGVVIDPSGGLVPGAEVTVRNRDTGFSQLTRTGTDGSFLVPSLPFGRYQVTVQKAGFKTLTREALELAVDQKLQLDLALELGSVDETVLVQSAAPALQTQSAETGQVIESRRIQDLPLLGRNFLNLTTLIPGVVAGAGGNNTNASVNGQREFANSVVVNGIEITGNRNNDNVVQPSVDAVEEFKAVTSSYLPEFGRAAGGVIAIQLKSGTNEFHGSAYEFLRTNSTTARGFFAPEPSQLKQHNFGASLGGPIIRDRTFFFASYEGGRTRDVFSYIDTTVPSQMIRYLPDGSVDLSGLRDPNTGNPIPIFDPDFYNTNYYAQEFPGNIIPADRVSRAGRNILQQLFPAPNRPGISNGWFGNFSAQQRYRSNTGSGDLRLDHTFDSKDRVTLTYDVAAGNTFTGDRYAGAIPVDGGGSLDTGEKTHSRNDVVGLSYIRNMRSSQLNELRVSYVLATFRQQDLLYGSNLAQRLGAANVNIPGFPQTSGFPQIFLASGAATGGSTYKPLAFSDHNFQLSDNYSWIIGPHNFKFGYEYRHLASKPDFSVFPTGYQYYNGAYSSFTSDPSYSFFDPDAYYGNGGNEIADLLLGLPGSVVLGLQSVNARTRSYENHFFAQDAWRITNRLVLTYGVRYEYQAPYTEVRDQASNFDPGSLSMLLAGRGGHRRSLIEPDKNNFAPRLGIAWRATPKTSIRAGWGVFYSPENDARSELLAHNFPYFIEQNIVNVSGEPYSYVLDTGIVRSASIPVPPGASAINLTSIPDPKTQGIYMVDPRFRVGYSQMLNFTAQREIMPELTLEAGYVGAFARKLSYQIGNINRGNRITDRLGIIQGQFSTGNSNYNSLQIKLDKRFTRGYSLLASYTYAKSIDDGPAPFNVARTRQWPQDPFNLRRERAASSTDIRHNFVLSGIWELPFARSLNGVRRAAFGGWQLNAILTMRTGLPVNVVRNGKAPGGFEGLRPNLVGDPNLPRGERTLTRYFDTGAFSVSGLGATDVGNAGRNLVRAPGFVNGDVSLFKQFALTERGVVAQVRIEAFNVTNTPHFAGPNSDMSQGDFGTISGTAGNPRILQFALKLKF